MRFSNRSCWRNILIKTPADAFSIITTTGWYPITSLTIHAAPNGQFRIQTYLVSFGSLPGPDSRRHGNIIFAHSCVIRSSSVPFITTVALPITMDISLVRLPEMVQRSPGSCAADCGHPRRRSRPNRSRSQLLIPNSHLHDAHGAGRQCRLSHHLPSVAYTQTATSKIAAWTKICHVAYMARAVHCRDCGEQ